MESDILKHKINIEQANKRIKEYLWKAGYSIKVRWN